MTALLFLPLADVHPTSSLAHIQTHRQTERRLQGLYGLVDPTYQQMPILLLHTLFCQQKNGCAYTQNNNINIINLAKDDDRLPPPTGTTTINRDWIGTDQAGPAVREKNPTPTRLAGRTERKQKSETRRE